MIASLILAVALASGRPASPTAHDPAMITYRVRRGDCLWSIAGELAGDSRLWPAVYADNRAVIGADPDLIWPGEIIRVTVSGRISPGMQRSRSQHRSADSGSRHKRPVMPPGGRESGRHTGRLSGTLDCSGLESLWIYAGGNPLHARMAASIAMAESGGYQYAHSPTDDFGYWQVNISHGGLATYDAYGNATAAIVLSRDGTYWYPWTTYTSGAYRGFC